MLCNENNACMGDRRRHKRVPVVGSATLHFTGKKTVQPMETMTVDISMSGMGVYSDRPIEKGTSLAAGIRVIASDGSLVTAFVEGTGVFFREIGNFYFVGIEFGEEIDPGKQPFLSDEIQKLLN